MATIASTDDVRKRLGRPFKTTPVDEEETATVYLVDVESKIRGRIKDLNALVTAGTIQRDTVVRIEADVVVRKLQNPEGWRSETKQVDDWSRTRTRDRGSDGRLALTDEEWDELFAEMSTAPVPGMFFVDLGPSS
ncbi:Gp19/Gp15/Gp42 family protein [Cellulosimicrobium aquatile]|uniref:Gp19/Gp15/Gp42 family protein n=1 Tax=Cellulosimicrobium aquatile TaxID=1612203 RepID=UPI00145926C2|nr:hypothetical protein [Cellulosimicrobium aquatile]